MQTNRNRRTDGSGSGILR